MAMADSFPHARVENYPPSLRGPGARRPAPLLGVGDLAEAGRDRRVELRQVGRGRGQDLVVDGRGVRVIVTGDEGKGDAELFNSLDIKYESCWNKKWAPGLVRTR